MMMEGKIEGDEIYKGAGPLGSRTRKAQTMVLPGVLNLSSTEIEEPCWYKFTYGGFWEAIMCERVDIINDTFPVDMVGHKWGW